MFRKSLPIIFAVAAVAVMLAPAVDIGYASSYTAATTSIGNNITTDYFTAGLYTYRGSNQPDFIMDYSNSDFTPVTVAAFNQGRVAYTQEQDGTYRVNNGITNTAINDLYIAITSLPNHTMVGSTFTLTYTVTGITEADFTGVATLVWGGGSPAVEYNKAYRLHLSLSNLQYSGDEIPEMEISVVITLTDNNSASYVSAGNSVTFEIATPIDEFKEELDNINPGLEEEGMGFYTDPGNPSTGEPAGVYIQNSNSQTHSIADSDSGRSSIDVNIVVPSGTKFCVYVTIKGALAIFSDRSDLTVTVKKVRASDGYVITNYGSTTMEPNWYGNNVSKYVYLNGNRLTNGNNKPTNDNQYISCAAGEEISISFSGDQNTTLLGQTMTVTAKLVMK